MLENIKFNILPIIILAILLVSVIISIIATKYSPSVQSKIYRDSNGPLTKEEYEYLSKQSRENERKYGKGEV